MPYSKYSPKQKKLAALAGDKKKITGADLKKIMAKGVKHYFKTGKEHKGATHKDAKGRVMSGKTHTASSKYLVHKKDLSARAKKVANA